MSLVSRRPMKALALGIAAATMVGGAAQALAQAVVVRSTGPSAAAYPMGKKLPANASVSLKPGDHVTVLDKSGTRVLSGPGIFTMTGAVDRNAGVGTALASLMARSGGARTRTGAVRGAPTEAPVGPPAPESVWYIDVSKGGTYCVADPAQVILWRPNRDADGTGKLAAPDGAMADVAWRAGNALKLWPAASVPVTDGQTYKFVNPVGQTVQITTKVLASVPEDPLEVANLLADDGCTAQLGLIANAAGN
ncbi:hypothetical protein [Novosphingobium cyanobacteriorum]|uniref:Uncharacterized protein n=1 Tax=Novosphingobium cyanobacteriorum TaxID=3024215 RepID=A0ABT6CEF6_9SPHN|nr:hypothetical protein [Novosphingobium cyanobacteriorum]MDF8332301.1 hypothetical protein [Novosphingobium cyanobacteriorum]